jgi:hypothetical protein
MSQPKSVRQQPQASVLDVVAHQRRGLRHIGCRGPGELDLASGFDGDRGPRGRVSQRGQQAVDPVPADSVGHGIEVDQMRLDLETNETKDGIGECGRRHAGIRGVGR